VTLLQEGTDLLLIDTGYDDEAEHSLDNRDVNWRSLRLHLELANVRPEAVTAVFVTHCHLDHIGNIERFPEATWYCPRQALADYDGPFADRFVSVDDGDRLLPSAVVLDTPGHTRGHGSILWRPRDELAVRFAICGDAILSLGWLRSEKVWKFNHDFFDEEAARASAAKLLLAADLIVPGHGEPFFSLAAR
jgi:glyoxylase-like metal-dependent hydrolase (beta-lactamase superfamily II)